MHESRIKDEDWSEEYVKGEFAATIKSSAPRYIFMCHVKRR